MRRYCFLFLLVTTLFFCTSFINSASAAPAPWGIAINEEIQECAGYWSGDEFSQHYLPDGWDAYYPSFETGISQIETPVGSCDWIYDEERACCADLGYTYVSDNIGVGVIFYDDSDIDSELLDDDSTDLNDTFVEIWGIEVSTGYFLGGVGCCCLLALAIVAILVVFLAKGKKKE